MLSISLTLSSTPPVVVHKRITADPILVVLNAAPIQHFNE